MRSSSAKDVGPRASSRWRWGLCSGLSSACRERMGTTPFQVMTGRPPVTVTSVLAGEDGDASCEQIQALVAGWVREKEELRCDMVKRVRVQRKRVRELSGHGHLPMFEVGDYFLVARARKTGRVPKHVQFSTGLWHVVPARSEHACVVEYIVTRKPRKCT